MTRQDEPPAAAGVPAVTAGQATPAADDERFRLLVETVRDYAILSLDVDGHVTSWNAGAELIKGYTAAEILGRHFSVFYPAEEQAANLPRDLLVAAAADGWVETEGWRVRKDGTLFWATVVITALYDDRHRLRGYGKVTHDDTERRAAEQALAASEERFRLLVEGVRDYAILSLDVDGLVTSWNAGAQLIKGYTAAEIIGRHFSVFYPPEDLAADVPRDELVQAAADGRIETEGQRVRKDGTRFWASVVITALYDDRHRLRGYGKLTRDITVSHRQREELERAARSLSAANHHLQVQAADLSEARDVAERASRAAEAASAAKSTFLATMSHEIRTPLNGVIGLTDVLLHTSVDAAQRDHLETIRTSGEALLELINDILDWSRIESGTIELDSAAFDVRDCVEGAVNVLAAQIGGKDVDLLVDLAADCPPVLVGDVARLRQILVNLVGNALKFTPQGHVLVTAGRRPDGLPADTTAGAAAAPDSGPAGLRVTVTDTGIGIAPGSLHRLFTDFSQADTSFTRGYGGSGLGLAISQRLARAMGGRITVKSQEGAGSTFTLDVPLRAVQPQGPLGPSADQDVGTRRLTGRTALVVADSALSGRILAAHLSRWGMRPQLVAPEAVPALLASGSCFDVGLLDTREPDGAVLAGRIARLPAAVGMPMVLLTSRPGDEAVLASLDPPPRQVLKPARAASLQRALLAALADRSPAEALAAGTAGAAEPGRLRVLLVDDNPVNRKVAQVMLHSLGYASDTAVNGLDAIEAAGRTSYDLVLMDVQMPVMDGLEATRALRDRPPPGPRPWVVGVTAGALTEDRERCLAAGMDDYLPKPFRRSDLAEVLTRVAAGAAAGSRPASPVGTAPPTH